MPVVTRPRLLMPCLELPGMDDDTKEETQYTSRDSVKVKSKSITEPESKKSCAVFCEQ